MPPPVRAAHSPDPYPSILAPHLPSRPSFRATLVTGSERAIRVLDGAPHIIASVTGRGCTGYRVVPNAPRRPRASSPLPRLSRVVYLGGYRWVGSL